MLLSKVFDISKTISLGLLRVDFEAEGAGLVVLLPCAAVGRDVRDVANGPVAAGSVPRAAWASRFESACPRWHARPYQPVTSSTQSLVRAFFARTRNFSGTLPHVVSYRNLVVVWPETARCQVFWP